MAGRFAGFESYRLCGVRLSEEEFGRGSYAVVLRLEYRGLKCAGKQLYPVLYEQGVGDTVRRFEEECRLLAQMRHPNIVQFIGVYFEEGSHVPILVMEFLPTTLARCIDTYGVLPEEVSYSILHDVALGLYHLHSQTPPIIHRDLSANNVLLTPNMTAKISDLGVARILNLTPQQMSRMTSTPGTPAYMPPEAMRANPRYDARMDEFSYGILMIHVLSGKWPLPVCEAARPDPRNPDQLIPVSEADRREEYLQDIGNAHPLMDLILRCVSNNPARRARAAEIIQQMADMVHQFPPSFADKIEMLHRIETESNEKQTLRAENQRLVAEAEQHQAEVQQLVQGHQEEIERFQLAHSIENVQTRLQLQEALQTELETQSETHQAEMKAEYETHRAKMRAQNETHQAEMKVQNETHQAEMRAQNETLQSEMRAQNEIHQAEMRAQNEARRSLTNQLDSLQTEVARLRGANESLQATVSSKNEIIQSNTRATASKSATLSQKESELASKNDILEQKSSTIRELNEQLTQAREFLSGQKPQPHPLHPQAKITWEPCKDLPVGMTYAQPIVIRGRVYCGGGAANYDDEHRVFYYSPSEDTWNTLPACDVRWFGLSQVRGKLVTVGGIKKADNEVTNEVYEFDDLACSWKQSIPPMPTARDSPAVLSHHSTLTVAGGNTGNTRTTVVEVFREETSQWHTTEPLPFRWWNPSSLLINNRWYLLGGGTEGEVFSNRAVCAHIDLLLQKALPRDQASTDRDSTNNSAWEVLPNTPQYRPDAATFGPSLLAVGGTTTNKYPLNPQIAVHAYSPCTKAWVHISDLPAPRSIVSTAKLSPTELLLIGGWFKGIYHKSVYKGLLRIE